MKYTPTIPPRSIVLVRSEGVYKVAGFARMGARPVIALGESWLEMLQVGNEKADACGCEFYIETDALKHITTTEEG